MVPPIVQVDYQAGVVADSQATAGAPLTISLDVHHLAGAAAPRMANTLLWYSTDGSTWQAASLRQHRSGHYTASIPASALRPGTSVSLHVQASDHGGNSIDQTLTGALQSPRSTAPATHRTG